MASPPRRGSTDSRDDKPQDPSAPADSHFAGDDRLRLATAIHYAVESIVMTDLAGIIQYVNPAFETITGYTRDDVIGRNPRLLKSGRQDAAYYRSMWEALRHGRAWHGRFVNRRKDGAEFTLDSIITPVLDASGAVESFVSVGRDISGELRLEAELRQSQKMETIGRLAGSVAHDFNNLLSVIIGYADVVLAALKESDPVRADISQIRQAGDRAAALTRQLLAFSRQQALEPETLDLNRVVHHMDDLVRRLVGEAITFTLALAPGVGPIRADQRQLEQVLMNLVVNARDAMPQGGTLTVGTDEVVLDEVYTSQRHDIAPGQYVVLAVSDTGIGMDEATQHQIFDPFFTTKPAGKGTGLGLATVYGIVKQSGGHIHVYSELGQGTTFRIYLPRTEGAAIVKGAAPVRLQVQGRGESILLVEDESAVRRIAERILTASGYLVLPAANGVEGLDVLARRGGTVDLLITDVVMPRMNGRDLAREVRQRCPAARILFMSGYTDDAIASQGVLDPDAQFIEKPFNVVALQLKVRQILDG